MDFVVAEKAAPESMDNIFQFRINHLLSQKGEAQPETVKFVTLADKVSQFH